MVNYVEVTHKKKGEKQQGKLERYRQVLIEN